MHYVVTLRLIKLPCIEYVRIQTMRANIFNGGRFFFFFLLVRKQGLHNLI